jgi:hypothetical protein
MSPSAEIAPTDFDFMVGSWNVTHRRLNERLVGCTAWTEFTGTSSTRKILRGFGNVEDNVLHFPEGPVHAVAVRSFDPKTRTWAIWWLDGRSPHHLDVPVVGQFAQGVGSFYAEDVMDGRPIRVPGRAGNKPSQLTQAEPGRSIGSCTLSGLRPSSNIGPHQEQVARDRHSDGNNMPAALNRT